MKNILMLFHSLLLFIMIFSVLANPVQAQADDQKIPLGPYLEGIIKEQGIDEALKKYDEVKNEGESSEYIINENQLVGLAGSLSAQGLHPQALTILKLAVREYPESVMAHYRLGGALLDEQKQDSASLIYHKTLDLIDASQMPPPQKSFMKSNTEIKLLEAEEFEAPSSDSFNYFGFYGGAIGGAWDRKNLVAFKSQHPESFSYKGFDLYRSPAPLQTDAPFTSEFKADVVGGYIGGFMNKYVSEGQISPVNEIWEKEGLTEKYPDAIVKLSQVNGDYYYIPNGLQWNTVWYRKDIFTENDWQEPRTWNDLMILIGQINEAGKVPFSVSVADWTPPMLRWFSILNLRLNGPDFHQQVLKGEINFTHDKIKNVFTHLNELFDVNAFAEGSGEHTYADALNALIDGRAVMYFLGDWIFENIPPSEIDNYDFFRFPAFGMGYDTSEIVHTYGAYLPQTSSKKEMAEDYLRYASSEESQKLFYETTNRVVAHAAVSEEYPSLKKDLYHSIGESSSVQPLFEFSTEPDFTMKALTIFQQYWNKALSANETMDELEKARKEIFMNQSEE